MASGGNEATCEGCAWTTKKWQYLGWKPYCRYYRALRNIRCIDFKEKAVEKKGEGIGIMAQGGSVFLHFYANQTVIQLTAQEASDFADNLNGVALAAIKQSEGLIGAAG